jgi:hypothetical protein
VSQDENLRRVTARIGGTILKWWRERIQYGWLDFHVEELREYVTQSVGEVAPGSPDRVMRDLRQKGVIHYKVLARAESLYQIQLNGEWEIEIEML